MKPFVFPFNCTRKREREGEGGREGGRDGGSGMEREWDGERKGEVERAPLKI